MEREGDTDIHLVNSHLLFLTNHIALAAKEVKKVLKSNPDNAEAQILHKRVLSLQRFIREAESLTSEEKWTQAEERWTQAAEVKTAFTLCFAAQSRFFKIIGTSAEDGNGGTTRAMLLFQRAECQSQVSLLCLPES